MAQEIERKFLVVGDGWRQAADAGRSIRQGYLSSNAKATVRVRTFDDTDAVVTIKGKSEGISRAEFEYPIPIADAREMLAMAAPHTVEKRRFQVPFGGHIWEVDVFEGRHEGLVLAEVELDAADRQVDLPDWAGAEVSTDERYFNATLARG